MVKTGSAAGPLCSRHTLVARSRPKTAASKKKSKQKIAVVASSLQEKTWRPHFMEALAPSSGLWAKGLEVPERSVCLDGKGVRMCQAQ